MSKVLVVIPARYGSSRFPGKALADLAGQPLVVRVAERAARMDTATAVIVATDDERIAKAVTAAGFAAEITGEHATGSDRVGEVLSRHDCDIVINLQGDEPLIDPADCDRLVAALNADASLQIATCAHPFSGPEQWRDPGVVKVLVDRAGRAVYFSRAAVPGAFPGRPETREHGWQVALRHVGIYGFRRAALERFLELPASPLEQAEGLEQLRALEDGMSIAVVTIASEPVGVDTPADLDQVRRLWSRQTQKEAD